MLKTLLLVSKRQTKHKHLNPSTFQLLNISSYLKYRLETIHLHFILNYLANVNQNTSR